MRTSPDHLKLRMEVGSSSSKGPETIPAFWNPGLYGIQLAPESFREKVHAISSDLEVTWNREICRWQVFCRSHRVTHPISRGWRLLFIVQDENSEFVPLDERTLCKIWAIDGAKVGSSKVYFDRLMAEQAREKAKIDAQLAQEDLDGASEYFDYAYKPKVGYGAISTSKMIGQ